MHCVIIGFSCKEVGNRSEDIGGRRNDTNSYFLSPKSQKIFLNESQFIEAKNINGYLLDAPDIFIESRSKPLCNVPPISKGCQPTDGGNLIIEEKDYDEFSKLPPAEPVALVRHKWLATNCGKPRSNASHSNF